MGQPRKRRTFRKERGWLGATRPARGCGRTAGQMPGHPEADQLGALEGILGDGVPDLRFEVLHAPGGRREGLGDDVLVQVVVVPGPAVARRPGRPSALSLLSLRKSRSSVMAGSMSHGCDKPCRRGQNRR